MASMTIPKWKCMSTKPSSIRLFIPFRVGYTGCTQYRNKRIQAPINDTPSWESMLINILLPLSYRECAHVVRQSALTAKEMSPLLFKRSNPLTSLFKLVHKSYFRLIETRVSYLLGVLRQERSGKVEQLFNRARWFLTCYLVLLYSGMRTNMHAWGYRCFFVGDSSCVRLGRVCRKCECAVLFLGTEIGRTLFYIYIYIYTV